MKRVILIVFLLAVSFVFSQENGKKKNLKVGLVLSGGGAKGIAHIAVLKELEEAGIRVDYIGGTSIGAIVGALYASGYNANQLDSIVRSINFTDFLTDKIPRKSKPFQEKEYGEKFALTLPVKYRKVGIPNAISNGQNVLNLLTKLTQHVGNIHDFSKLPIPFLCVATNLVNGEQEVLKNGFLAEAVKASGSFPTLLAPVEIGGKLLTDGGIVNNFPVDEVKAMGADVIIGVDIQAGLDDKNELDSAVKILNQIVGFQMYKTLDEKYKKVDLLIKPDMSKYTIVSFDKADEILEKGKKAAFEKKAELKAIAAKQNHLANRKVTIKEFKKFQINNIEIKGNQNYTRAYVLGKLNLKKKDTTSYKSLIQSINNLTATGNFESVKYRIESAKNNSILKVKVKENSVSNFLQFGAHYDHLYKTGILINTTSKHIFNKNDVMYADLILGDNLRYNFNYFIDNGFYTSFGIKLRYNSFNANIKYDDANINKINLEYEDLTNQIYFQTIFSRRYAIGFGVEHKRLKVFTETISLLENSDLLKKDNRLFFDKSNYFNAIGFLKIDTYDKKYFQKKGFFLNVDFKWYLTSTNYSHNFRSFSQLKGKIGIAHTFFNKLTTHFESEAGVIIGENENRVLYYNLGGYGNNFINTFIPMYGYDYATLSSNAFLRSLLTVRYEFVPKNYLLASANFARVDRDLFNEGKIFENTKSGYLLGYGLETFLGPIEFNYTWSPDTKDNFWYFSVGYWF